MKQRQQAGQASSNPGKRAAAPPVNKSDSVIRLPDGTGKSRETAKEII